MRPQRVHRRRSKGWKKPEGAVYVGRGSKWGNPYDVAKYGRDGAVILYRNDLANSWAGADIYDRIRAELAGKDLMCWCSLDQKCHADVLLELANETPA